jgi:hypothetical protein
VKETMERISKIKIQCQKWFNVNNDAGQQERREVDVAEEEQPKQQPWAKMKRREGHH